MNLGARGNPIGPRLGTAPGRRLRSTRNRCNMGRILSGMLPPKSVRMTTTVPDRTEAAEYYFTYIKQVPAGDINGVLQGQLAHTLSFLRGISDERSLYRYAPAKWSIRQVLGHINDAERLFVFRAFWFARGFDAPLPSFDQNIAVSTAAADHRTWDSHIEEFRAVRDATLTFFWNLPVDAWMRRGIASDNPFTVRALAFIAAGHVEHHVRILRERYLSS